MKLLLDTCTLLWLVDETQYLSPPARAVLEDPENELIVHQVSTLEIQLKYLLGKLSLALSPVEFFTEALKKHALRYQTLTDVEIWHLAKLPDIHADPFDRLLIAYALCEGLKLITPDPQIHRYPVPVIW